MARLRLAFPRKKLIELILLIKAHFTQTFSPITSGSVWSWVINQRCSNHFSSWRFILLMKTNTLDLLSFPAMIPRRGRIMKAFTDPNIIGNLFLKAIKRRIKKCQKMFECFFLLSKFFLHRGVMNEEKRLWKLLLTQLPLHCHYWTLIGLLGIFTLHFIVIAEA